MSKTVDSRVVEMRFDNKNFENNVSKTMSTLDKLKQKLNLSGASKGLDGINNAAKNVNLSGLSSAVDTVHAKFSALQVVGVTALANITNSAINTGKRMISALTLDPVMSGFEEYETQINAIQTILSNTRQEGTNVEIVNKALDELNTYADKTIYNFTEMTRNIGTFTAAGVKLDTSVNAIKGIANLAAVSGSSSQQASTAMYQLSQALAAGKVQLMDWNSVVNAGMGGKLFQDALIRTSELLGTGAKAAIEASGSFRESLTDSGWLTSEVLTETLNQLAGAYDKAELMAQGFSESQADEIVALAKDAESAAQDVKTFTQLWDTMKESAQSGWAQTWRLIVGDFEEAKTMLTKISDLFTGDNGFITKMSNSRNELLEGTLGSKWEKFEEKINKAGIATDDFKAKLKDTAREHGVSIDEMVKKYGSLEKAITSGAFSKEIFIDTIKKFAGANSEVSKTTEDMTDKLEYFQKVVDKVWYGDYDNGAARVKALTEAGYDYNEVQSLVNKTVDGHRLTLEDLSDTQLKSIGYTEKEIDTIKKLAVEAEKTGTPLNELIEDLEKPTGRQLLIESLYNVLNAIINPIKAVKQAWTDIFPPMTSDQLYNIIEGLHTFTSHLVLSGEGIKNLKNTFKGLFALIDIVATVIGGPIKIGLKLLCKLLGMANVDVLSVTGSIGEMIVKFRDFLFENNAVIKGIEKIAGNIDIAVNAIKRLIQAFLELPAVQKIIENIKESFPDFKSIGQDIINGLKNGLSEGITSIPSILADIGRRLLAAICDVLGIQSPSKEMFEVGENIIQGLINGLKFGIAFIVEIAEFIAGKVKSAFTNIDWSTVFAGGISIGMIAIIYKFAKAIESLTSPLEGLGDVFSSTAGFIKNASKGIKGVLKGFSKVLKAFAFKMKVESIQKLLFSFTLLVAAVAVLSFIDKDKLDNAVWTVTKIAGIFVALVVAIKIISSVGGSVGKSTINLAGLSAALLALSVSILLISAAVKSIGSLNEDQAQQGFAGLTLILVELTAVLGLYGKLVKGKSAQNIGKVGKIFTSLAVSLLLMAVVIRLIGGMDPEKLQKGLLTMTYFVGVITALSLISRLGGKNTDKLGKMMTRMATSMILMVVVIKLISGLSPSEITKGVIAITAFVGIIALMTIIARIGGRPMEKLGRTLISMSVSMMLMVGVIKLISSLSPSEITKGIISIGLFVVIIAMLTAIVKSAGNQAPKIAATILAMSIAIGIMAGICVIMSLLSVKSLAKGLAAVTVLGLVLKGMISATRGANECKGNLILMSVAIGVMAAAIAVLSMIDGSKLAGATAALSVVMGMFAIITKEAGRMNGSVASLIAMTVAVGLIAGIIYVLSSLPIESVLASAGSLSMLLLSLSVSMAIISKLGTMSLTAIISVGAMTAVVLALGLILRCLSDLPVESTLSTAISLSVLLLALSGACAILTIVGLGGPAALIGIASLAALIVGIGGLIAGIGALVTEFPTLETFLNKGIPILEKIGYALGSFLGNIISGFTESATSTLPAVGASLSLFMLTITPFINGLKSIDSSILDNAGSLAGAIIAICAADVISAITSFLTGSSRMESFAVQLLAFGNAMVSFSKVVSGNIDAEAVNAAANAGSIMVELQKSLYGTGGLIQSICGEKNMTTFGTQIKAFGQAIVDFSSTVKDKVDSSAVTAAANAGTVMAELQKSLYGSGGFIQMFAGEKNMSEFGSQIVAFGNAIVDFSSTVAGNVNTDAVTAAANAGSIMSKMQETIVPTGGVFQAFSGSRNMATFGSQIVLFGKAIVDFSETVTGRVNIGAATAAANAGSIMSKMQETIVPTGGVFQLFSGSKNMSTFGSQIKSFGQAIVDFSETVSGNVSLEAVTAAANAGSIMAELQKSIPEDNWFDGKVSMDDFGSQIKKFGDHLVKYSDKVSVVDNDAVSSSITAANRILSFANRCVDVDKDSLENFKIKPIGEALKSYSDKVSDMDQSSVSNSISTATRMVTLIKSMNGLSSSGVTSFKNAVNSLGSVDMDGFVSSFKNVSSDMVSVGSSMVESMTKGISSRKSSLTSAATSMVNTLRDGISRKASLFTTAGKNLVNKLISGLKSGSSSVSSAVTSALSNTVSNIRGKYNSFYNAGSYVMDGLINGIRSKKQIIIDTANNIANTVENVINNALQVKSPSKVLYRTGCYAGQGFVNGLAAYEKTSYEVASNVADYARSGFSDAISRIRDIITGEIDVQPTIRPVLDLSDVKSGANRIGTMFGLNPSVGVSANIGAISSMMSQRIQNGPNSDVVSSIEKLRRDISKLEGNTYNVNGVTYDDGTNISEAVKSLIRAAKIERRV